MRQTEAQAAPKKMFRPKGCQSVALILQGGGALGAYQAGVYEAMHEAGLMPDWVAGISIGAVNAALIAGNEPDKRLERLQQFWETITRAGMPVTPFEGDEHRKVRGAFSAYLAMMFGQNGFFRPNYMTPWFSPRGASTSSAFYDTEPLRETLSDLVNFELIKDKQTRFAVGAVEVTTGNFVYFDNANDTIGPEHIMASGALPPGFPAVKIGEYDYWDGGLVSNTPLQHLLENCGGRDITAFQVDLFSARGPNPRDMYEVLARQKDIQYSSRTRLVSDYFRKVVRLKRDLQETLDKVPDTAMSATQKKALIRRHGLGDLPRVALLQMVYQQSAWEADHKDYEFSRRTMKEHWKAGYADTKATIANGAWLEPPMGEDPIVPHDIHRAREGLPAE